MKIKCKQPVYIIPLRVSGGSVKIRPYTIEEEKIILLAKDASTSDVFADVMVQMVDLCTIDMKESSSKLPIADLVELFVQLRAKSVGEISELRFTCKKEIEYQIPQDDGSVHKETKTCNGLIQYDLNLNELDIENQKESDTVMIDPDDGLGIKLKYVSVESIANSKSNDDADSQIKLIYDLMVCVFDNDTVETKDEISYEEFSDFIKSLPISHLKKILDHINTNPSIVKSITLKCPQCGNETPYTLRGVNDFF